MAAAPAQLVFPVTTLFVIVKNPDVHATSPEVPLYKDPIAEAEGVKSIEDAAIESTDRIRRVFFMLDSFSVSRI
jgi:hypothetical protein